MENIIPLCGEWKFKLDPENQGVSERYYTKKFQENIKLPGSTDEAGYGTKNDFIDRHRLSRLFEYTGVAWYQKDIYISKEFKNKSILLFLERCHWETRVWIDDKEIGIQDSLCTAHEYDITNYVSEGAHILTVSVDNNIIYNVGKDAHSVTKETQTNWNGIIGAIELRIFDKLRIGDLQIYPDVLNKAVRVELKLENKFIEAIEGKIVLKANSFNTPLSQELNEKVISFKLDKSDEILIVDYEMGDNVLLWDEFSPALYKLAVSISGEALEGKFYARKSSNFGMRVFKTEGTQFTINGRLTFLRGTLECCVFPITGYPPTDLESWLKVFKTAKDYGLNHFRFHSWCPPEAAFDAADQTGFMLQIETPVWAILGEDELLDSFIYNEGDRILRAYGNHPSFCMLTVGNEPSGENQVKFLSQIVDYWKGKDSRRLYSGCSGWPEIGENEYHVLKNRGKVLRCQDWEDELNGRLNANALVTDFDFEDLISGCKVPIVSHEIGQWCVYPDLKEIKEYTGVLRARNFELVQESLAEKGMFEQADRFLQASGKLQTLLYKEDIEAALRTPGFGGFQLLGLNDFPGQGTALVGLLNAFWKNKGYVDEKEFKGFCSDVVPLLRMKKVVWTNDEIFKANIQIANFGKRPLENAIITYGIAMKNGGNIVSFELNPTNIPLGNEKSELWFEYELKDIEKSCELIITVGIKNTGYVNSWSVWVYPSEKEVKYPENVLIAETLEDSIKGLEENKKVLFLPKLTSVKDNEVGLGFTTIFWNTEWTSGQKPHTLGVLCDPENNCFEDFVTDEHSSWQWFDLIENSKPMIMDEFSHKLTPLIQVIDDWNKNRKLGLLFQANVGNGKLILSSIDLKNNLSQRPVARQLLKSLLAYMSSEKFEPEQEVSLTQLKSILTINT